MKATIYAPREIHRNWTDADSTDVEFDTIDALLTSLEEGGAPEGLRVVVYNRGRIHYLRHNGRWVTVLRTHE